MKRILAIFTAAVLIVLCASACGSAGETDADGESGGKLQVVATLFPQYDFARNIGGDKVEVSMLLPPGTESHSYDPTPSDIISISNADVFLYTGSTMEPWASTILDGAASDTLTVVDLSEHATLLHEGEHDTEISVYDDGSEHSHEANEYDPHIWLDLSNASAMAESIADVFCELDPENEQYYRSNCASYVAQLDGLDAEFMALSESAPDGVIVFGGRFAYGYFVNRYNIKYVSAYESCSGESEPSVRKISEIISFVRENGIDVIYHEELSDPKVARSIASDTGAELLQFNTCHNVTSEQFENGTSFIDLMRQNLDNLKRGLA